MNKTDRDCLMILGPFIFGPAIVLAIAFSGCLSKAEPEFPEATTGKTQVMLIVPSGSPVLYSDVSKVGKFTGGCYFTDNRNGEEVTVTNMPCIISVTR